MKLTSDLERIAPPSPTPTVHVQMSSCEASERAHCGGKNFDEICYISEGGKKNGALKLFPPSRRDVI